MSTATDKVRAAMHALEDEVKALEAENNRLSTIYATIWTNARRHGATEDEIEGFIDGTSDFVAWMKAKVETPPEVTALVEALRWYAGNVCNCNRHGSDGDMARDRLANDIGNRASAALAKWEAAQK